MAERSALAGVVAGLAVGDQSAIERSSWLVFRRTGVAHLLAVSGLYITLFALLSRRLADWAWRRSTRTLLACPALVVGPVLGLVGDLAYAVLAGWGVLAQRTALMLAVVTFLRLGARRLPGSSVLLLAATAVVAFDPRALLQPGFWLSFVAVVLLMGASPAVDVPEPRPVDAGAWVHWRVRLITAWMAAARAGWHSQWVVTVGLAPWTLICFNQRSLVGLLANALAIPWVTLLITPLALLGVLLPPLWSVAAWLVEGLMAFLQALLDWPLASLSWPAAPGWAQGLAVLGAAWVVMPLPAALLELGLSAWLPMLWPLPDRPAPGEFDLLGVDIGRGNAVLLRTARHTLVHGTGPLLGRDSNAGERVLVPLLAALGERRFDYLMLSHRDVDHVGCAAAVLRDPGARLVISSLEAGHPLRDLAPHQPCRAGQRWDWDGVRFEVLHPTAAGCPRALVPSPGQRGIRPNSLSCVQRVRNGQRLVLLTGDIERELELALLAREADWGVDVMLMPHHGSRTSSIDDWLAATHPQWVLIQAGHHNRYGHPAADFVTRYRVHGIGVIRTDSCGVWHWCSADASSWCERDRVKRTWRAPTVLNGLELAND